MTTEYTLTYFDARGSAEHIRLILAYVGAQWKEIRIPFDEATGAVIPEDIKHKLLFSQAPLLEFEGRRLVQSLAISRFLARRYNLAGSDEYESAECDQIVDACRDIYVMFVAFFREKEEAKKIEGMQTTAKTTKERYFSKLNEIIQTNGDFLVNNKFTWADIVVAHTIYQIERVTQVELIKEFPALARHLERIFSLPGIREWVATRPDTKY